MALRRCVLAPLFFGHHVVAYRKAQTLQTGLPSQQLIDADKLTPAIVAPQTGTNTDPELTDDQKQIATITCSEMPMAFAAALERAEKTLHESCSEAGCHLVTADDLSKAATSIHDHFVAADSRMCLTKTLSDAVVQERVAELRRLWPWLLASTSTEQFDDTPSVRDRFEQSLALIGNWRDDMLALASSTLDRRRAFPRRVEDVEACPDPCISCSRRHNSVLQGTVEQHSFKCILPRKGSAPVSPAFLCEEPRQRSGLSGAVHGQRKTWCDVRSWHIAAEQSAAIVANTTCGAEMILGPIMHGFQMQDHVLEACLAVERGEVHVEALAAQTYQEYKIIVDFIVSEAETAAFRIFMELGMAEALADLRRAARGNQA